MRYKKSILTFLTVLVLILISLFVKAYPKKTLTLSDKFMKYNNKYKMVVDENITVEKSSEQLELLLKKGTGVIFIGSPKIINSRKTLAVMQQAIVNYNLQELIYSDEVNADIEEEIKLKADIKSLTDPLVLFILDGDIIANYQGQEASKLAEEKLYDLLSQKLSLVYDITCDKECAS